MKRPRRHNVPLFIVCILIPLAIGALGGLATAPSIPTWYAGLRKPPFNPPAWIFGPVWTALYAAMGIASYLVARHRLASPGVRPALTAYMIQLVLNAAWSPVFFSLRMPWAALGIIVAMFIAIAVTTLFFRRVSRPAAILMLPYLAWVAFATVLNFSIAWLNR